MAAQIAVLCVPYTCDIICIRDRMPLVIGLIATAVRAPAGQKLGHKLGMRARGPARGVGAKLPTWSGNYGEYCYNCHYNIAPFRPGRRSSVGCSGVARGNVTHVKRTIRTRRLRRQYSRFLALRYCGGGGDGGGGHALR